VFKNNGLTAFKFPKDLEYIGDDAFIGNPNMVLESGILPSGLTYVGINFLGGCQMLPETIVFPEGVTTIPDEGFPQVTTPNKQGNLNIVFLGKMTKVILDGSPYQDWAEQVNVYFAQNTISDFKGNVYSYTCELPAGTYAYKFVVNGYWYADPKNSSTVDDGFGGVNSSFTVTAGGGSTTPDKPVTPGTTVTSPVVEGNKVTFNYASTTATRVEVFGNFNDWSSSFELVKDGDVFSYTMELPDGEYEYKFQIDGTEWILDPANSNHRNNNNVLVVGSGNSYTPTLKESVVINGNKVTIYYENPNVDKVEFMSSANNWEAMEMTKDGSIFSITLELEKGDYQYKFLLNGTEWINDPLNPNTTGENNDNVFSVTSDAPVAPDTEKPGTETPGTETPDTQAPDTNTDAPAAPMADGVIILISAIVTIVVVLRGVAAYLFLKKKNA
jgi:hypothetical protein